MVKMFSKPPILYRPSAIVVHLDQLSLFQLFVRPLNGLLTRLGSSEHPWAFAQLVISKKKKGSIIFVKIDLTSVVNDVKVAVGSLLLLCRDCVYQDH